MTKHNPENERIKRKYFAYLKEAEGHSEQTVDAAAKSLSRFEEYTRYRDFKRFHYAQATAFKRHLAEQRAARSGERLSKATLPATVTSSNGSSNGLRVNLATSHAFSTPMLSILTFPIRTRGLRPHIGNSERRHWSRCGE